MPVDSIHDHAATRTFNELRREISSLRHEVRALERELDRKLDRHDPQRRALLRKVDMSVFSLRMWCSYLTASLVVCFVGIIVVAAKLA